MISNSVTPANHNGIAIGPELPSLLERLARGLDMYREHAIGIQGKLRSISSPDTGFVGENPNKDRIPETAMETLNKLCEKLELYNDELLSCYRNLERII